MPKKPLSTSTLLKYITEAIQEKKGKRIVIANLQHIEQAICDYFIICQGNSPAQVNAIVDSVEELARIKAGYKPFTIDGKKNAEWVVIDYGEVMVHIFQPEARRFYNLEHLWADAKLKELPDID